jgi:phage replication-related protein YjqB (UPF0714/DUF867 family)
MMGLSTGQQVRIERPTENGTTIALYTIGGVHDEESNYLFLDYDNPDDVKERFGVPTMEPFQGKINPQVAAVDLTDAEAEVYSEFIEHLADNDYNNELAVIAPHGGDIEPGTDEQAVHVAEQLSSKCVSVWLCKGFKKGGGALERWHITSTDISEQSFPKLKTIFGRRFKYAIAFHGWKKDSICIGGSTPDYYLKLQIKSEIKKAVSDTDIRVEIAGEAGSLCSANFNGNDDNNIVNRLSENGLQIEQCKKARENEPRRKAIAKAVADVIRPKLTA